MIYSNYLIQILDVTGIIESRAIITRPIHLARPDKEGIDPKPKHRE
jgi:hypothetical protein